MLDRRVPLADPRNALRIVLAALTLAVSAMANGQQLLMFESDDCSWCQRWHEEVGDAYEKTDAGRKLPLRRIDIYANPPAGIQLRDPVRYTPTFVVVDDGGEIGRITGYPGEAHFWGLLDDLIAKVEN